MAEPTLTLGLFDGAMNCSPKEAWEDALDEARRLRYHWLMAARTDGRDDG